MPTLRQLEVFLTVAQQGSIGRAADALGISQPGVSRHIKSLEGLLGQPLFLRRRGAPSRLSELGQEMVSRAQDMVELQRQFHRTSLPDAAASRPTVSANPFLLAKITGQLANLFPAKGKLHPVFRVNDENADLPQQLINGAADYLLTHIMAVPEDTRLRTRILRLDPCSLYIAGGRGCADDWIQPSDLNSVQWRVPSGSSVLRRWIRQLLEAAGIRRENIVEGAQFVESIMVQILESGGGSVFMDRHVAHFARNGQLVRVPVEGAPLYLVLLARKDCDSEVFDQLAETLAGL